MEEGVLTAWHVVEGSRVEAGDELLDIETTKISNAVEAGYAGVLRRQIGQPGQSYPCGALIGVIAEPGVPEQDIESFVAEHSLSVRTREIEQSQASPVTLEVNGRLLRFLAEGSGDEPVILIHGFGGDLGNWQFTQPLLSEKRATYAIDLPGHGGSSKDVADLRAFEDMANHLVAFLDQLNLVTAHVVGHSMGAAVALALASKHSHRVASLTLLSPAGLGVTPAKEFVYGFVAAKSRREVSAVLKMLVADETCVSRDMVEDVLKYKRLDGVQAALEHFAQLLEGDSSPALETLSRLAVPIQIIWGACDRVLPPLTTAVLPKNIALTFLQHTGHMPHLERSSQVAALINDFLGRFAATKQ
jgi:pyruvate dehydrogenase E2 component (dihydrolipoamide acetyltransferase)